MVAKDRPQSAGGWGIRNARVAEAFRQVPRREFVEPEYRDRADEDTSLPIGEGQTISQPSLVAKMLELLGLEGKGKVLEIGTGSGFETAVLSLLSAEVYSVERVAYLAKAARERLRRLGFDKNTHLFIGNGSKGWPKYAPYEAIVVSAAASRFPEALVDQLKEGGRIIIPVGGQGDQILRLGVKRKGQIELSDIEAVSFVPLVG